MTRKQGVRSPKTESKVENRKFDTRRSREVTLHSRAMLPLCLPKGGNPLRLAFLFTIVLLLSQPASAQVATGFPLYGSFSGGTFDTVDNANRNVHFEIPIINKAGRGMPFKYAVTYDSSVWLPVNSSGQPTWTPVGGTPSTWGWGNTSQAMMGYVTYYTTVQYCSDHNGVQYPYDVLSSWSYYDAQSTGHAFPGLTVSNHNLQATCTDHNNGPAYSGSGTASDGSGWQISVTAGPLGFPAQPTATEYSVAGVAVVAPFFSGGSSGTLTDPNGNVITLSGSTYTDTLGTTALTIGGGSTTKTYIYTGPGGSATATFNYSLQTVQTNFGCPGVSEYGATPLYLVSEIDLPDYDKTNMPTEKYTINYEATPGNPTNVTGRIASITLPTGGEITYAYSGGNQGISCYDGSTATLTRTVYPTATTPQAWTYYPASIIAPADPQGNHAVTNVYFQGVYETERDVYQNAGGTLLETVNTCYNSSATSCNSTAVTLPITQRTVTTTLGNLKSQVQTFYNTYRMPTKVDEYDFGNPGLGNFKRETMTCYTSANWDYALPSAVVVYNTNTGNPSDCSGTMGLVAKTTYAYYAGTINLQTETRYTGGTPASISRTFTYGAGGVLQSSTDFKNHSTAYGSFTCETNTAFPTTITLPITSQIYTLTWDCNGGVLTSIKDPNGQTTTYKYTDHNFWRVTETDYTDSSQNTIGKTTIAYNDAAPYSVSTYRYLNSSTSHQTTQVLDGLGRIAKSQDNTAGSTVNTTYDSLGRTACVSNPYNDGGKSCLNPTGGGATTDGYTSYMYDALGRTTSVQAPDTSTTVKGFSAGTSSYCTTVTDAATKARELCSDGLGRITSVIEDPGQSPHLNYQTTYTYDPLNDLAGVSQGVQTRTYIYDMLGRLTSAQTPEAGTTTYSYAVSGNLCSGDPSAPCSRTDARSITTTYTYNDNLNRLTAKTYSDSTPPASYSYDQASVTIGSWTSGTLLNPIGRMTEATTSVSGTVKTGVVYSYDPMGRTNDFWQCDPNNCGASSIYNTNYNYDWAGDVTSWSHPGLINITNIVNTAQQITAVQTTSNYTNLPQTFLQNVTYTPWGAVSSLQNGCSGSGCTNAQETYTYNNRLQPAMIQASGSNGSTCLVYNYYADKPNPTSCALPAQGRQNNGNMMGYWYNDSVQSGFNHTASYTYDNVNRLTQATATGNATYNQTYAYGGLYGDGSNGQYGNMTCVTGCTPALWTLAPGTNQLLPPSSYSYDAAGNLTKDSSNGTAHTYQWDAEGRVASVDSGSTWSFTYNAVGDRVQWVSPGGTGQHMFDPAGNWLGIYGSLDLVRFGDRHILMYNGSETYFNHVNHLNSTAMMTNHAGAAVEDVLFYPWGQNTWQVWGSGGYSFAGMPYYDTTTGTNPTEYRFYTQNLGRWLSPDPVAGDITNPQSLNLYAYVLNNPTSLIDPLGLAYCEPSSAIYDDNGFLKGYDPAGCIPDEEYNESTWSQYSEYVGGGSSDVGGTAPPVDYETDDSGFGSFGGSLTRLPFVGFANNGPNQRLLNIAQQVQKCGQFSNVGNQLAQGVNSGRISVGNVPSNAVATTNGWFNATSVIAPDALDDPSTVIHEWIHQTQAAGNPFFLLLKGANQIQSLFTSDSQGFLDYSAQNVANKIVSVCGVK